MALLKSHIAGYFKKDGTFVAHEDKRTRRENKVHAYDNKVVKQAKWADFPRYFKKPAAKPEGYQQILWISLPVSCPGNRPLMASSRIA